jgi:hypothetical protein
MSFPRAKISGRRIRIVGDSAGRQNPTGSPATGPQRPNIAPPVVAEGVLMHDGARGAEVLLAGKARMRI